MIFTTELWPRIGLRLSDRYNIIIMYRHTATAYSKWQVHIASRRSIDTAGAVYAFVKRLRVDPKLSSSLSSALCGGNSLYWFATRNRVNRVRVSSSKSKTLQLSPTMLEKPLRPGRKVQRRSHLLVIRVRSRKYNKRPVICKKGR